MAPFTRRILFAADGSPESDLARERVTALMQVADAELHVVHVGLLTPWTNARTLNPDQLERLRAQSRPVLDRQVAALQEQGIALAGVHLVMGRATDEVLRLRDTIQADLIVLGSRGQNAFSRVLLGNDAESILRHAPCSVLIVRQDS